MQDIFGVEVVDKKQIKHLRKIVNSLLPCSSQPIDDNSKLPRQKSSPIRKRDLKPLSENKRIWVTENSLGTNTLLLSLHQGTYMIDDDYHFYKVPIVIPSSSDGQPQHETLLDGVKVFNHRYGSYCFMVSDVIYLESRLTGDESFSKRLQLIRDRIIFPLRKKFGEESVSLSPDMPFFILGKEFFELRQFDTIKSYISSHPDESGPRYLYENGKRYNDNLGFLFIPDNQPYTSGENLKVWKWTDLNMVNFEVQVKNRNKGKQEIYISFMV
eukprot:TRINITY_DN3688_c0_g1_i3.p1 TRINITY_DN3688_c0_g1~~TRINITY_DN3688_c0_g1_i3.p1  ORF type:complete len:270 (+),score=11.67 TRINITY_DN3688_c0_g1_i3:152-961(+)